MINIRMDLINQELTEDGFEYKPLELSNKFLNNLLKKYHCVEYCEKYYDSEPDIPSDLYEKYYDYSINKCGNKAAYDEVVKRYKEYEKSEQRLTINNWQDIYGKGIWGMSQSRVDESAKEVLKKDIQKLGIKNKDRLYYAVQDNQMRIYWYGRDVWYMDYWFIFLEKTR